MDRDEKIVVVTHEMFYGVPHALRDYLISNKIKRLIFIGLPFLEQKKSSITIYERGQLIKEDHIRRNVHGIAGYVLDLLLTTHWVVRQKDKYDKFIGIDVLNALSGIILKKIGKVKKVIFYAVDFSPVRFSNRALNFIYHKLEKICVKNADEVWNVSPKIAEGRERFLHINPHKYPQKVVNSGIWIDKIKKFPLDKVKKHQLLFLGHILKKQGLQMVLEATTSIIKEIPDFKFVILGGGEYENKLKRLTERLRIQKHIEFKGWIRDREIIDTTLGESAGAVATYIPEKEKIHNFSYYGDPIKIKEYLASGLPVVLTDVPHNAKEIDEKRCGILVDYKKEEIGRAVIKLFSSDEILKEYRENAMRYAKEYDWKNIFDKALV